MVLKAITEKRKKFLITACLKIYRRLKLFTIKIQKSIVAACKTVKMREKYSFANLAYLREKHDLFKQD